MNRPQNPYIAGNPINDQDRFIGRADVMRETLRVLRNPNTNAIVLHGQRRIGKTSILLRLEKDLAGEDYAPTYFDLQDKAAMPLGDVLFQLAQSIAAVINMSLPDRTQFDIDGEFFRKQFLPDAAEHAAPRSLVLLFDEFDVLDLPQEGQAGSAFFPYLRAWMAQALDVKFVFVLGRRPEELSTDTLATFKGTQSRRVSLVNQDETVDIIRLSEKNNSLVWTEDAIQQVWNWTEGHPYFTQLLCSEIWEAAYDEMPTEPPTIAPDDVDAVVDDAIGQGRNAFEWIWDGLPPAERIVMAAMAEEKADIISQQQLMEVLNRSGIRLILRELELAPETLEKWDLLRKVSTEDNDSVQYRFAIPLLKQWVRQNKPLRRVKAELDSIEPLAVSLYQSAKGIYGLGDLDGAIQLLNRALSVNPNHMQSLLLLGRVKLGQGSPKEA
ncbi:MAG: AAA-like domain-containing protein, partial [Chloroflexota bacterium]